MGIKYKAGADLDYIMDCVRREYERALKLFPRKDAGPQVAVLSEEHGEISKALLDHSRGEDTIDGVFTECVQTAAMAVRLAIGGSAEFPDYVCPPFTSD